jgi:catechol 2,3-dioxygenase-like lactoylglutathione lyase family enzyme
MLNVLCIDHIVLRTNNIDQLLFFYCDILGCKIEKKVNDKFIQLRAGESLIDLIKADTDPTVLGRNVEHFCLRINHFNYEALKNILMQKILKFITMAYAMALKDWENLFI